MREHFHEIVNVEKISEFTISLTSYAFAINSYDKIIHLFLNTLHYSLFNR